jgi:hypothetical protein
MKHHICTIFIALFALLLGWTSRGDYIYSNMFKNTLSVAIEREIPVRK